MEAPPIREGAFSPEASYYINKLARKEEECNEILAQFNKYKVKTKVRFDQLRHEINNILHERNVDPEDEQHHPAMLLVSLNETQFRLEESEKIADALRTDVERQQLHISDQKILIKNLEDQLRQWEESEYARERRKDEPVDMEKVQQQMMYKDERIVELNSLILDKERQILDLQDACRSASEVATSKKEAMRIVQKKFDDLERRSRREASTETDDRVTGVSFDGSTSVSTTERTQRQQVQLPQPQRTTRTSSPGRAVHVVNKNGCNSPPPLDPSELDDLPGTSKLAKTNVDGVSSMKEKKQRKRVTFDLPQAASREDISRLTASADSDEITEALMALNAENERLRTEMERMEREGHEMEARLATAESLVSEAEREARHASLKARAVAQARMKELEDRMASQSALSGEQMDRLEVEAETLRSTRDWEVEQNARMRDQLAHTKEKLRQLREELDASELLNRTVEKKLEEKEELMGSLVNELEDAESLAVFLEDQKHQILDDVDKLRDAMQLYEEYIELLEADIVIYETRVGNLREELGVSKMNQRDHIKSKAFNTKLQMINKEKEQIDRKANDERLRTKALHAKVMILEDENEKLMARLCEVEMAAEDTSSIDAACKQLQSRMEMAEAENARARAEYEAQLKAAEFAADSIREECDRLRAERDAAEQHNVVLLQQQLQLQHEQRQTQLQLQQQPGCSMQMQMQEQNDSSSLDAALRLAQSAQETLTRERDELADRVHVLGGENFELTTRTEEAEREVKRLESSLAQLESRQRELSERRAMEEEERMRRAVEREEELIELRGRIAEREGVENELKRLRSELDHAHLAMAESAAVKREVQQLQQQMELEREAAAAKWQQVAAQLKSYEELASSSGWNSRKTSIDDSGAAAAAELRAARAEADAAAVRQELRELQQMQLLQETSQQLQQVQHEIPRRVASLEDEEENGDRHEVDRLRARVEELESEVELSHELNVESGRTVLELQKRIKKIEHERRLLESLSVEFSEDLAGLREEKAAASAAPTATADERQPVDDEEVEELKKRLEELEEEAAVSEELHVEMGRTVKALEERITDMEMERRLHEMMNVELARELQELRQQTTDEERNESDERNALMEQLENERRQREREEEERREEVERLQRAVREAEEERREVMGQLEEKKMETESLVRATAATFDAVAVAAGAATASDVEVQQEQQPKLIFPESTTSTLASAAVAAAAADEEAEERANLVQQNVLLREAVYQNVRHEESVTEDVARLLELKDELEKAIEAFRGEIWSLNGQLKASVLDRENLQDRVVELDTKVSLEKRRADMLDVELAEQMDLRENAQRQAAEAENESNRRLAECAEMDSKREDLEKAYSLLAGYYSQLQEAYNVLYAQQQLMTQQGEGQQQTEGESVIREDRWTQTDTSTERSSSSLSITPLGAASVVPSSSRRAMAESYASRLAALRELSVHLTKSVLATELATLESELDNSITSIEGLSGGCPEEGESVDALLDAIIKDYDGSSGVSADGRAKIASVHAMLRAKISEVERVHSALREQRGVCSALEQRLTELEETAPHGMVGPSSPGTASSTGPSELEERIEECEALRAHVEQLQEIISRYVSREEAAAAAAPTVSCRAAGCSAQLALLAARLATREADVDSLFKTNAELAHENVRLQNEIDEKKPSVYTHTANKQELDEAELEMVKEELEEEIEARKEAEKKLKEMKEKQGELEDTILDMSRQLQNNMNSGWEGNEGEREEENGTSTAELCELRENVEKEKKKREEVEKELRRVKEEMEEMRIERQLKEAEWSEIKAELKKNEAELKKEKGSNAKMYKELKKTSRNCEEALKDVKRYEELRKDQSGMEWMEERKFLKSELERMKEVWLEDKRTCTKAEDRVYFMEKELKQLRMEKKEKEDNGEEEKKEEKPYDSVAAMRDNLSWERERREEAEEAMKVMKEEKIRLLQQLQMLQESKGAEKEEGGDAWSEDGWGEEKEEKAPVDELSELLQMRLLLHEETAARLAAEKKIEEMKKGKKEEEGGGWGEDWGESAPTVDSNGLMQQLQQAEVQQVQLREEMEKEREDYNKREMQLIMEKKGVEEELGELKIMYNERMEELESDNAMVRNTMVDYERIIYENETTMKDLEEKIALLEGGKREEEEKEEEEVSEGGWSGDGWNDDEKKEEEGDEKNKIFDLLENPNNQPEDEEVNYNRNQYVPEDDDEVSELFHILNGLRDEAADLQDASRHGGAPAHHKERIGLRLIVKKMADKLQELEDDYFNDSGHLKETLRMRDEELKDSINELSIAYGEVASLKAAAKAASAAMEVENVRIQEEGEMREEMERLKKQNSLLQESEDKLAECLDTSNERIERMQMEIERIREEQKRMREIEEEKLREEVKKVNEKMQTLESAMNVKEAELGIERREKEEAKEEKRAIEGRMEKMEKMMEEMKKRKDTVTAARGPTPNRSYVGGSRRSSAASSVKIEEEELDVSRPPRVHQGQLEQQMDFSSSASSTVGDSSVFRRRGGK